MRLFLLPYNAASASGKALATSMGIKRCTQKRSIPNPVTRTIINWGHSGHDLSKYVLSNTERVYNPPDKVAVAINKLSCLQVLLEAGVTIPPFTTNRTEALVWINEGKEVVERHLLRGSGGEGINIRNDVRHVRTAPLYTMYVKKKHEYRVHIIAGQVADVQRKGKRSGATIANWKIRNLDAGFIFLRSGVDAPQQVIDQAVLAMQALDLDFGAVDVIFNAHEDKAYVLEVNTACGLEGTTLEMYADGLKSMIDGKPLKSWRHWQEAVEEAQEEPVLEWAVSPPIEDTPQPVVGDRYYYDDVRHANEPSTVPAPPPPPVPPRGNVDRYASASRPFGTTRGVVFNSTHRTERESLGEYLDRIREITDREDSDNA
jgi:hypothetical protein